MLRIERYKKVLESVRSGMTEYIPAAKQHGLEAGIPEEQIEKDIKEVEKVGFNANYLYWLTILRETGSDLT